MEDFFTNQPADTLAQHPPAAYSDHFDQDFSLSQPQQTFQSEPVHTNLQDQDDFGPPEEDEVTRRIRQQEESLNKRLMTKSNEEYQLKIRRREEGRRQMEEYLASKQRELEQRKKENLQAEQRQLQRLKELSNVGGWEKVVASISTAQGERKGTKDITRMRESILHRRDDQRQK